MSTIPESIAAPKAVPLSRTASLKLNFVVVGGSIGGLAAAFALSKAGHFVHVVERRDGLVKVRVVPCIPFPF